jgi:hypothetical protein
MQSKINTTHCKVQCGNEFRRFLLPSNKFSALESQIRSTFGFPAEKPLVIKYTDEEGDNVTISSDEELEFAITLFAGGLLRLIICGNKGRHNFNAQHGCGIPEHHGKWENRGAMWKCKWEEKLKANPELLQNKISKLDGKVAQMKERLQWLENKAAKDPNPSLPHRISHFQTKIARFEHRLAHLRNLSGGVPVDNNAPVVAPINPTALSAPVDKPSWKELKESIFARKSEMRSLREQVKNGTKTKAEASEKIFALKEEIIALRQQHGGKGRCGRKHSEQTMTPL